MTKRFLTLMLCVLMLLSIGCETAALAEEAAPSYNPLDYGMTAFDETVTIKIPVFDRALDTVPNVADNYYTNWVNENFGKNLNVNVEYIPITRSDTMGAYNLLLVGGDWPTIFAEYDWPKVSQWYADGALAKLDIEQFKTLAPVWFEKAGGQDQFDMFKLNGDYVFAPALRPYWNTAVNFVTWYRKDWYKKAGIELFTTYEEYVEDMQLFMELGYTNGKPILPKAPFTANFQTYGDCEWPRNEEEWVMYSDVSVAPLSSKSGYYVLKKQNNEYNKGLYSSEFELDVVGGSAAQTVADFINGEAYSYGNYLTAAGPDLEAFYKNNPDAELGIIYNTDVADPWIDSYGAHIVPQGRAANPAGYFIGFSSKATADEIKAATLYLEWLSQPDVLEFMQWGVEGKTYTVTADGTRERISWESQGDYWMGYGSNKDYWALTEEMINMSAEETLKANCPQGLPQDFTQELIDQYHLNVANAEAGLVYLDPFFTVNIDSVNEYQGTLEALFVEYATALVKCAPEDFDALYEQYSTEYLEAGYQELIDERLEAFKNGNSTKLSDVAAGRLPYVAPDIAKVLEGRSYTIGK